MSLKEAGLAWQVAFEPTPPWRLIERLLGFRLENWQGQTKRGAFP